MRTDYSVWQVMSEFTDTRHEIALKHVQDYFGISGLAGLETVVEPGNGGSLIFGSLQLNDSIFRGDFRLPAARAPLA